MASTINRLVFLVIFGITLAQYGSAIDMSVVVEPNVWSTIPDELNVTCLVEVPKNWQNTILTIEVLKEGYGSLVNINNNQRTGKGTSFESNMKATGFVYSSGDKDNQSFLTLTIDKPTALDAGTYRCKIFYANENNKIMDHFERGDVTYHRCPAGWTYYKADQTCIKVFAMGDPHSALTWSKSRSACQKFGGDLIIIRNEEKNTFVAELIRGADDTAWIGISNVAKVGFSFEYVDGSFVPTSYRPWRPSFPRGDKDFGGKCVTMFPFPAHIGKWSDFYCTRSKPYVCSISH